MSSLGPAPPFDAKSIVEAKPGDVLHDTVVRGLQLRVRAKSRSFYLYYRQAGRERRPKLGAFPIMTITAARAAALKLLRKAKTNEAPVREPTVVQLLARFMAEHGDRKKSAAVDRDLIRCIRKTELAQMAVREVKTEHMDAFHRRFSKTPSQANRLLALLRTAFNFAERWELRPKGTNPATHVRRFRERKRRRYMSAEESALLRKSLRRLAPRYPESVAFLWTLIYTGARPGELASAKCHDLQRAKIVLDEHKTAGTSGDVRTIQLPPQALAILQGLPPRAGDAHLFGVRSVKHVWRKVRADTQIANLRIYDLRHNFASIAISKGVSLAAIGELLGHKSPATTARYAHLMDAEARAAATAVADAFDDYSRSRDDDD